MPSEEHGSPKHLPSVPLTKALMYVCIGVGIGLLPTIVTVIKFKSVIFSVDNIMHMPRFGDDQVDDSVEFKCVFELFHDINHRIAKNTGGAVNNLKTPATSTNASTGNTVQIEAINVSRDLIFAMAFDQLFRNPGGLHHGYRVYFGKEYISSTSQKDIAILHPLDNNYDQINLSGNPNFAFKIVDIPAKTAGPCPDMCY